MKTKPVDNVEQKFGETDTEETKFNTLKEQEVFSIEDVISEAEAYSLTPKTMEFEGGTEQAYHLMLFKDGQFMQMMIDEATKNKIDKNNLLEGKEERTV
jgi:hypothetical protein